jgi:hypothetical protein
MGANLNEADFGYGFEGPCMSCVNGGCGILRRMVMGVLLYAVAVGSDPWEGAGWEILLCMV